MMPVRVASLLLLALSLGGSADGGDSCLGWEAGGFRTLSTKEFVGRAVRRVLPKWPGGCGGCRIQGVVILKVLVSEGGEVQCLAVVSGHPFLVMSALDAAKQWRFRPLVRQGRTVPFAGRLGFRYEPGEISLAR